MNPARDSARGMDNKKPLPQNRSATQQEADNKMEEQEIKTEEKQGKIVVTTAVEVPDKKVAQVLGIVRGNTVRARNIGRDIGAGFKSIVGGEIKTYTDMIANARDEAYNRMVNQAIELGADAIIGIRFMTSMIMQGASEMLAYGTAVKLK